MEVIEFPGYIEEEKLFIADRFLIPRQLEENGIDDIGLKFDPEAMKRLIREYTYEAGVRNLEREIGQVCRKIARTKAEGKKYPNEVTGSLVEKYLGPPQFFLTEAERKDEVGVATGLAWTENGGEIMFIEVAILEGKGNLQITGQVGDVMQESAQAALSYLKSRAGVLGIDIEVFERLDIHLHLPEGAIPKDGPSAGITLCTAMVSAFTGRPIYKHLAMTGEITLRGRVLPIGGAREKLLAAYRVGIKTVLIPERNLKDLIDVPKIARDALKIIPVTNMDQVLQQALSPDVVITPPRPRLRVDENEENEGA
jgi:ATP-dependent Lon protease